ncbi:Mpo1 family 2-hydroxy fatty acid dioxygenase [Algibacillus agarilyticus]|uniref:Mpo1 family 2-hydroxy fatty acid dioxygenase n=1 Tax=Algibacillus agarilyticus TaxID=2234133 RepID=UPI000DD0BB12|nr:Mpo1-like protein [Algibacillus agarilyticus]
MKTLADLFNQYSVSHQNPLNKKIHMYAVPAIYISFLGLINSVALPWSIGGHQLTLLYPILCLFLTWYFYYSFIIGIYMGVISFIGLLGLHFYTVLLGLPDVNADVHLCAGVFMIAWVAQFYGHKVEGRKPSFLEDIFFLLVGPAWVSVPVLSKLGIKVKM